MRRWRWSSWWIARNGVPRNRPRNRLYSDTELSKRPGEIPAFCVVGLITIGMAAVGPDLPPSLKTASAGCRASRVTHLVFGCGRGNHRHRASSCELRWLEPPSERTSLSWRRHVEIAAWAGSSDTNPFSLRRSTSRFYVALPGWICIRLMRLAASPRFSWMAGERQVLVRADGAG